ncbi:hypothetical protein ACP70R_019279 [Stipagrostis hirtigluma subsp. patula]
MVSSSPASQPARPLLLLALALATAAAAVGDGSVCDTANCGKGKCAETPGIVPGTSSYKCECDPGWSQALKLVPFAPCVVPNCTFDKACFNTSLPPPKEIPPVPLDICAVVNCGEGGVCKKGDGLFAFSCECRPGYVNLLNLTAFACVKNCFFGKDCSALGLGPPPSSAPPSPPSPAPSGNHNSSGLCFVPEFTAAAGGRLGRHGSATVIATTGLGDAGEPRIDIEIFCWYDDKAALV